MRCFDSGLLVDLLFVLVFIQDLVQQRGLHVVILRHGRHLQRQGLQFFDFLVDGHVVHLDVVELLFDLDQGFAFALLLGLILLFLDGQLALLVHPSHLLQRHFLLLQLLLYLLLKRLYQLEIRVGDHIDNYFFLADVLPVLIFFFFLAHWAQKIVIFFDGPPHHIYLSLSSIFKNGVHVHPNSFFFFSWLQLFAEDARNFSFFGLGRLLFGFLVIVVVGGAILVVQNGLAPVLRQVLLPPSAHFLHVVLLRFV